MCYHLITFIEYACTHQYPTRRHYIDCNQANCRLSRFHKPIGHDCIKECSEIFIPDQSLVMDVVRVHCNICLGIPPQKANGLDRIPDESDSDSDSDSDSENEVTLNGQ